MDRKCVSAIRVNDYIIYRVDLATEQLNEFIASDCVYFECEKTPQNNLYYDGNIILSEWSKYKIKSLSKALTPYDFSKCGEFISDEYGVLLYKNCVGIAKFREISFCIFSEKISSEEYARLVDIVNSYIVNLSYDFNQSTCSEINRDITKTTDIEYHVYLLVRNALSTENYKVNIFRNFSLIKDNPCRSIVSETEYQDINVVNEISEDSIQEMFSGNSTFVSCNNSSPLAQRFRINGNNHLPQEVYYENTIDSLDNAENRFIKYFFSWCLQVLDKFQTLFTKNSNFHDERIISENEHYIKKIKQTLTQSFLRNVGNMSSIPMYSTVLTRRDGYRNIFQLFLGIKSMPTSDTTSYNIREILENKSLDVIYENYCYFGLAQILSNLYNQKLENKKFKVYKTAFSKTLEKRTDSNYFEFEKTIDFPKIQIHYNKNYIIESYSKPFDPDISIEIYYEDNTLNKIYIFDAKFKMSILESDTDEETGGEIRRYKFDDISKMHTYRDAIKKSLGAFVLYPGTEEKIYYENDGNKELLCGVGAFKMRPGKSDDLDRIQVYLSSLLKNNN
ncbi:MAG: DUF2357 domain-containing protein [Ruminococcus sp.]